LPGIDFGWWSSNPAVRSALRICPLFFFGIAVVFVMHWFFGSTRWGLFVRAVGDKPDAARAMGISVWRVRTVSIMTGSFLAGMAGAYLSLYYPGSWTEKISGGQGMIAVALVIFARWNPIHCLWASLLFGGAQALGPALQSIGISSYYYLFNASPYILTLLVMVLTCSNKKQLAGQPGALGMG
jgi:simple sugar transport system permease protein